VRKMIFGLAAAMLMTSVSSFAQTPATAAPAAATAAKTGVYKTNETEIGTLLDDPAARVILNKHIPGMTDNPQVDMARSMTLKDVQQYSPDQLTDQVLAAVDADFAKLAASKK